jgi:hypothetical protein
MMIFVTYHEMKRLHDSKVRRSLARYEWSKKPETPQRGADVVELVFGAHCDDEERLGA